MSKLWSYTAGSYGNTVTVYERTEGGTIQARWRENGKMEYKSLRHSIKARARNWAHELSDRLTGGDGSGTSTLATILKEYEEHRTPKKGAREQKADAYRNRLFKDLWGSKKPSEITLLDWDRFIASERERGLRNRAIEAKLKWINVVLNWATKWHTGKGYLLTENPVRGFEIPYEKNPRQPVLSQEHLEKLLEVAHLDLFDLLVVKNEAGRRLSAVCGLKWTDFDWNPHVPTVVWSEDTDKRGIRSEIPISQACYRLLSRRFRERQLASPYVFSSPADPTKPLRRDRADKWLRKAFKDAGIPLPDGSLWHTIRRKWASERPETQAVAKAGGWANLIVMLRCYKKPSMDAMREAVEQRTPYREAKYGS